MIYVLYTDDQEYGYHIFNTVISGPDGLNMTLLYREFKKWFVVTLLGRNEYKTCWVTTEEAAVMDKNNLPYFVTKHPIPEEQVGWIEWGNEFYAELFKTWLCNNHCCSRVSYTEQEIDS